MNNAISNIREETGEILLETGKIVKKQVMGDDNKDKKIDPVTGKPIINKKTLANLNQQVAQLAQMRIKKVREELEKQRLKVAESGKRHAESRGPEVPAPSEKPKEDVISQVLKQSKSTGEFGKNIGG